MGQCIIAGAVGVWILGVTGRCESRGLFRDDENGDAPVRFYANLANNGKHNSNICWVYGRFVYIYNIYI
jgi:hypothetical protein